MVDEDGQYRLFSEGEGEEGTEVRTAAQRLATSTVSSVAQRLRDIGARVRMLASQAEARALVGDGAEYAKYKRRKNKIDNTTIHQVFYIFTDRKAEITSEILKQKNQYNDYDYEVFIGIVNLNGDLYFYKNFDGQDFEVFATCNYGKYSEEVEKQLINEIKNGTIRNSKSLGKFIEGIEDKLRRYYSDNNDVRNRRNSANGNGSFYISEQANERRDSNEGSEFTWYSNGEDDRIEYSKVANQQLSDAQSFLYRLGGIYKFSPISSNTFVTLGAGLTNRIVDKSAIDNARNTLTDEAFDEYVTTIEDYIADNKPNKTTVAYLESHKEYVESVKKWNDYVSNLKDGEVWNPQMEEPRFEHLGL